MDPTGSNLMENLYDDNTHNVQNMPYSRDSRKRRKVAEIGRAKLSQNRTIVTVRAMTQTDRSRNPAFVGRAFGKQEQVYAPGDLEASSIASGDVLVSLRAHKDMWMYNQRHQNVDSRMSRLQVFSSLHGMNYDAKLNIEGLAEGDFSATDNAMGSSANLAMIIGGTKTTINYGDEPIFPNQLVRVVKPAVIPDKRMRWMRSGIGPSRIVMETHGVTSQGYTQDWYLEVVAGDVVDMKNAFEPQDEQALTNAISAGKWSRKDRTGNVWKVWDVVLAKYAKGKSFRSQHELNKTLLKQMQKGVSADDDANDRIIDVYTLFEARIRTDYASQYVADIIGKCVARAQVGGNLLLLLGVHGPSPMWD